jgi:UDP-2,3-diacylglucosamine pyrophosphatase LpxH
LNQTGINQIVTSSYTKINTARLKDQHIHQILVISDLHLSEGYSLKTHHWHRRENFTADTSFAQFLNIKSESAKAQKFQIWLIINGDFIDFLRIASTPDEAGILEWEQTLQSITSEKLPDQQQEILDAFKMFKSNWQKYVNESSKWQRFWQKKTKDEMKYGLKTQDFKSVYRLMMVNRGHEKTFEALANWLNNGHLITIISGNHDQEFDQSLTQAGFNWILEKIIKKKGVQLTSNFSDLLSFERHGLEIDDVIRIEHGNRFEWHTKTQDQWLDPKRQELFLAAGSLFNRYFLNRAELKVPFLDNVKPVTRVFSFLLKYHKSIFVKIFGKLIETVYRLACKKGARSLILLGFLKIAYILIPLIYFIYFGYSIFRRWDSFHQAAPIVISFVKSNLDLFISLPVMVILTIVFYLWSNKLTPQFCIAKVIEKMSEGFPVVGSSTKRHVICGHKHAPDIQISDQHDVIYLNSGTWCPIFEYDSGIIRDDMSMTFIELKKDGSNWESNLKRWLPFYDKEAEIILREPLEDGLT